MFGQNGQPKFYTLVSEGPLVAGQPFQIQYVVEGVPNVERITVPMLPGFSVLEVFDNQSTSFQSNNNSQELIQIFSKVVVVSIVRPGSYYIPGAVASIGGKSYKSNPLKIKVVKGSALKIPEYGLDVPVEEASMIRPGENLDKKVAENFFIRATTSKPSCYVGEELVVSYKLYSRLDGRNLQVQRRPSLTGFSVVEMVESYDRKPDVELYKGQAYNTNLVRLVHAFPLQTGTLQLEPAEVSGVIHLIKPGTSGALPEYVDHPVSVMSNPLEVQVKPLPPNQPDNFSGSVGKFTITMEVMQKEIHPGDLVKIRMMIAGTGNITLVVPPLVNWPKGVDTADPVVKEAFNKYVTPMEGSKVFEYSFAAPDTGHYIIPATSFVYFNPSNGLYETSRTDSIDIQVTPDLRPREIRQADQAITEYNKPKQLYYFAGVVMLILGWITYQLVQSRKKPAEKKMAPVEPVASVPPAPEKDPLKIASEELEWGTVTGFYQQLQQALWTEAAEAARVTPSELNKRNLSQALSVKGVAAGTINELLELLNECEWALYVPSHEQKDPAMLLERARAVLNQLK